MKKQVIIDQSVVLTRIALLINGECREIYAEQTFKPSGQSKVIQGQIEKIASHLKAAFVNFGDEKNGLLHFSKIPSCYEKRVQQGLRLPVQVTKENSGEKGHKLSAYINIPGYYLVCLPFEDTINISRKITDGKKRAELKALVDEIRDEPFGFIVRTNSQDASKETLTLEIKQLIAKARKLMQYKDYLAKGDVLLEDDPLAIHLLRDWIKVNDEIEVISNDSMLLEHIKEHMSSYLPEVNASYKAYPKEEQLFSVFSLEKLFENALKRKVWLKNGGNLVIEQTEAMTVVDVNSAKAIEKKNPMKAVRELNELAISETIRQMVFRNLSGIVVVDLIDIKSRELREELFEFAKQQAMQLDGLRTRVFPISDLDLLQMSREKKYQKLSEVMLEPCGQCHTLNSQVGSYYHTFQIEQKLKHIASQTIQETIYLSCGPAMKEFWSHNDLVKRYKEAYGITVQLSLDYPYEKYALNYHI